MSGDWDVYFSTVEGRLCAIYADLGLRSEAPKAGKPRLHSIDVDLLDATPEGLADSELAVLTEIMDQLQVALEKAADADFVAAVTMDGCRQYQFYAPAESDEAVRASASDVLKGFSRYKFELRSKDDPDWKHYVDFLFPNDEEIQTIFNQHLIEVLEESGISLDEPQEIEHQALFRAQKDADAFSQAAQALGFRLVGEFYDDGSEDRDDLDESPDDDDEEVDAESWFDQLPEPDPELAFGVRIGRVDDLDLDSVDEVTLQLITLAKGHGGEYDGWELETDMPE